MHDTTGAPYHVGDPIVVNEREGTVREIKRTTSKQPFGLCWVVVVAFGRALATATVDDNGYNFTRTRNVRPSDLVLA